MRVPAWRGVLDGVDLTERLAPRLLDLSLTESRGDEADQVDLRVHDHDGRLALPRRGVTLQVAIGYEGSGLVDKGTFKVDDVEHSGSPDIITIRARSADLTGATRRRRERSWHDTTLLMRQVGIAEEQAQRQALEHYAYFPPHHRWRMRVHDARAAWVDVMSVLHINDYWSRPELQRPPEAYWHASRAFALAQGFQLPETPPPS